MPLGPSSGRVARYTLGSAPSLAERNPRWLLKSVAVNPGLPGLGVQVGPGLHQVHFAFEPLQGAWDELKEKVAGVSEVRQHADAW